MKVFEFHPETGIVGELIDERRIASWGDASLEFLASNGDTVPAYKCPSRPDADFTSHIDAGFESYDKGLGQSFFVSYKHDTKWIAFCTGQITCGEDEGIWDWWIVPSREALPITNSQVQEYQTWGGRAA